MTLAAKLRRAPLRAVTGALILEQGLSKMNGDDDQAKALHGMAAGAYPIVEKVPPKPFLKALAVGEIALGGALLAPIVPAGLAGLGLTGFAGALLGLYWRTPGLHAEGNPRPTRQGITLAKDTWLLGIGTALVVDAALTESPITGDSARAEAKATLKAEAKATRKSAKRSADHTRQAARRAAKRARKQAESVLPG
jgi:hypothetical protein